MTWVWVWSTGPTWWKERRLLHVVLWFLHANYGTFVHLHTYLNVRVCMRAHTHVKKKSKNFKNQKHPVCSWRVNYNGIVWLQPLWKERKQGLTWRKHFCPSWEDHIHPCLLWARAGLSTCPLFQFLVSIGLDVSVIQLISSGWQKLSFSVPCSEYFSL